MSPNEAYKCAYAVVVALERLAKLTESMIVETQLLNQKLETMNRTDRASDEKVGGTG